MKRVLFIVPVAFLATACAFGNARVVRETKTGGEIALEGQRGEAQTKANNVMAAKCGSNAFEIDEQGETVVGQESSATSRSSKGWLGPQLNTSTATVDTREWRIKYHCKGSEPPPAEKKSAYVQHEVTITF